MKLSIIIPVYCVEDTLDRCIESVLSQNYHDMEIILVDDGSPDHCPEMCDNWQRKDHRVSVIHQTNGGLSDARNSGIEKATGDYITFVDSDDHLASGTYMAVMELFNQHPEYDLVEFPCTTTTLTDQVYSDMNRYWLDGEAYRHTYAWNKIFRKSLFDTVRFPVGKVFEDVYTLPLLLAMCKTVATTANGFYYYVTNKKGISQTAGGKALNMLLQAHVNILRKGFPMANDDYYMHVVNIQMDVYELMGTAPVIPPFHVRPCSVKGFKQKAKAVILNLFGIKRLCQINNFIHHIIKNR